MLPLHLRDTHCGVIEPLSDVDLSVFGIAVGPPLLESFLGERISEIAVLQLPGFERCL